MAKSLSTNKTTFLINIIFLLVTLFPAEGGASKAKVVLVHGFRGGGYAWWKVVFSLETMGYNVTAVNLKASGLDPTHISEVETFDQYNEPLERYMSSLAPEEKVVVVAHSAGGVSLTKILHDYTEKVAVAVYVAATMLKFNYLTCQDLRIGVPYFSESKCSASCPKLPQPACFDKQIPADEGGETHTHNHAHTDTEEMTLERMLGRPGPYRAIVTSKIEKATRNAWVDRVPRVYIKTRFDRTLLPENQDAMVHLWPPTHLIQVNSDHDLPSYNPQLLTAFIVNATSYYYP